MLSAALRTAGSSSEVADGIASIVGSLPVRPLSRDVFLACPPMARDEVVYHLLSSEKRVSYDGVRRIRESIEGERLYWYVRTNGKIVRSVDGVIGVEDDKPEGGFCVSVDHLNPGTRLELANGLLLLVEEDGPGLDPLSLRVPVPFLRGCAPKSVARRRTRCGRWRSKGTDSDGTVENSVPLSLARTRFGRQGRDSCCVWAMVRWSGQDKPQMQIPCP